MTAALEGVSGQQHAPAYFTPGKDPVPIVQRLSGPQGRSGRAENLAPPWRDPARSSVAISTELPGPHIIRIYTAILPTNAHKNIEICSHTE